MKAGYSQSVLTAPQKSNLVGFSIEPILLSKYSKYHPLFILSLCYFKL